MLRRKVVEKQPPLAAGLRLSELFARQACSVSDAWACASVIGRCAILLASSPRALSCDVVSIVAECCCCRSTYIVRCADIFDRSLLRIYLFVGESTYIVRMSDIADSDTPSDPMVADNRGSGDDPLGVPCTPGLGTTVLSRGKNQSLPTPSAWVYATRGEPDPPPVTPALHFPQWILACCASQGRVQAQGTLCPACLRRRGHVVQAPLD